MEDPPERGNLTGITRIIGILLLAGIFIYSAGFLAYSFLTIREDWRQTSFSKKLFLYKTNFAEYGQEPNLFLKNHIYFKQIPEEIIKKNLVSITNFSKQNTLELEEAEILTNLKWDDRKKERNKRLLLLKEIEQEKIGVDVFSFSIIYQRRFLVKKRLCLIPLGINAPPKISPH